MSYAPIDCSMPWHPRILALKEREFRVHITALLYANEHLTDGVITRDAVKTFPGYTAACVKTLEDRGLWLPHVDGWLVRNFLKWNPSAEKVAEMKEKKSRAGKASGRARGAA